MFHGSELAIVVVMAVAMARRVLEGVDGGGDGVNGNGSGYGWRWGWRWGCGRGWGWGWGWGLGWGWGWDGVGSGDEGMVDDKARLRPNVLTGDGFHDVVIVIRQMCVESSLYYIVSIKEATVVI